MYLYMQLVYVYICKKRDVKVFSTLRTNIEDVNLYPLNMVQCKATETRLSLSVSFAEDNFTDTHATIYDKTMIN